MERKVDRGKNFSSRSLREKRVRSQNYHISRQSTNLELLHPPITHDCIGKNLNAGKRRCRYRSRGERVIIVLSQKTRFNFDVSRDSSRGSSSTESSVHTL